MTRYIWPLLASFFFVSCQSGPLSYEECEKLSYQIYRGIPHSRSKFDKGCTEHNIPDMTSTCNAALAALTIGVSEKEMKEKWGENIFQCFNDSLLKKHLNWHP